MANELKFGSGIDVQSTQILHVADGSASDHAATYGQLMALIQGLAWKDNVRAASTANVNIASPGGSLDGITLVSGQDSVLLKDQTAGAECGLYDFHGAGSPLTRRTDADTGAKLKSATVLVDEGTINADRSYTMSTDGVTVGTTAQVWVRTGGNQNTAGDGMDLSGGAFSVKTPAGSWLIVDGTGVRVDKSHVVGKFAATIGDGSSTQLDVLHGFASKDITWSLRDANTDEGYITSWAPIDINTLRFYFASAPANNGLRVVVHG